MKSTPAFTTLCVAFTAALSSSLSAHDAATTNPDKLLRGMSAKIAASNSFSFHADRQIDPALLEGRALPEKASIDVRVARPNRFEARSVSRERTMRFVADGKNLTIFNESKKHYAQVPMRVSIDELVESLDKVYGFTPPLADFAVSNPYAELRRQAQSVAYLGLEKTGGFLGLGGVECHQVALKGKLANATLWIGANDQLPRKLVATFHGASKAQVQITFSAWNLAAPNKPITFTPPAGTEKIEMWTKARMDAARKH